MAAGLHLVLLGWRDLRISCKYASSSCWQPGLHGIQTCLRPCDDRPLGASGSRGSCIPPTYDVTQEVLVSYKLFISNTHSNPSHDHEVSPPEDMEHCYEAPTAEVNDCTNEDLTMATLRSRKRRPVFWPHVTLRPGRCCGEKKFQ